MTVTGIKADGRDIPADELDRFFALEPNAVGLIELSTISGSDVRTMLGDLGTRLTECCPELIEIPVLLQTGKDMRVMEIINACSSNLHSLYQILPLLPIAGIQGDGPDIDGTTLGQYPSCFRPYCETFWMRSKKRIRSSWAIFPNTNSPRRSKNSVRFSRPSPDEMALAQFQGIAPTQLQGGSMTIFSFAAVILFEAALRPRDFIILIVIIGLIVLLVVYSKVKETLDAKEAPDKAKRVGRVTQQNLFPNRSDSGPNRADLRYVLKTYGFTRDQSDFFTGICKVRKIQNPSRRSRTRSNSRIFAPRCSVIFSRNRKRISMPRNRRQFFSRSRKRLKTTGTQRSSLHRREGSGRDSNSLLRRARKNSIHQASSLIRTMDFRARFHSICRATNSNFHPAPESKCSFIPEPANHTGLNPKFTDSCLRRHRRE